MTGWVTASSSSMAARSSANFSIVTVPAVTALLVVNLSFGVMSRVAPQLNVFSLGFPFSLLFGLAILWVSLYGFGPQFQVLSERFFEWSARFG